MVSDATQGRLSENLRDVFNQSPGRRFRDLQIGSLRDVSETLHETSKRCI